MSSESWGVPPGFGQRLKEERTRLGKNQAEFAQAGGVGRLSQIQYEGETTSPTTRYLSGIANIGVDLAYLVLGVRLGNGKLTATQEERIDRAAFDLIEAYAQRQPGGQLNAESRRLLYRILRSCLIQVEIGALPADFNPATLIPGNLVAAAQE
jgi:transcriptional regulator with XRE-family HTH domain